MCRYTDVYTYTAPLVRKNNEQFNIYIIIYYPNIPTFTCVWLLPQFNIIGTLVTVLIIFIQQVTNHYPQNNNNELHFSYSMDTPTHKQLQLVPKI